MDTFSTVTHGMIPCFLISILCWSNESQATNQEVWKDDCLVASKSNLQIQVVSTWRRKMRAMQIAALTQNAWSPGMMMVLMTMMMVMMMMALMMMMMMMMMMVMVTWSPGMIVKAPSPKAMTSVMEVTVTEMPACRIV